MTTVYFIRHGESVTNLDKRFTGQLDEPLTEKGRAQAALTGEFLKNVPFAAFYSSDLQRAYDTAVAIAGYHGLPVTGMEAFREINGGLWQGLSYDELPIKFPEDFSLWRTEIGMATCTGGESMLQVQQRAVAALNDLVAKHPDDTICITAHGGVLRVLIAYITGVPMTELHKTPTWVTNASVSIAEFDGPGVCRLVERDMHAHLDSIGTETVRGL